MLWKNLNIFGIIIKGFWYKFLYIIFSILFLWYGFSFLYEFKFVDMVWYKFFEVIDIFLFFVIFCLNCEFIILWGFCIKWRIWSLGSYFKSFFVIDIVNWIVFNVWVFDLRYLRCNIGMYCFMRFSLFFVVLIGLIYE